MAVGLASPRYRLHTLPLGRAKDFAEATRARGLPLTTPPPLSEPVQLAAEALQPAFRLVGPGAQVVGDLPEPVRMVEFAKVRHLVGREVVEHEGRSEDQAPGEIQGA